MKTSTDRILTTHTGSLPRPKPLIDLILRREKGAGVDATAFESETAKAVQDVVARQVEAGIDVVSDGEMSKPSYTTYIRHRVSGIEMDPRAAEKGRDIMIGRDRLAFLAAENKVDQRLRPRQAAGMGGEDAVGRGFHGALRRGVVAVSAGG